MDIPIIVKLIAIPIISAATGYLTNYIAVRMLFRPRKAFRFGPFSIQGLIPKRRHDIATRVAETVETHLLSHDDIRQALDKPEMVEKASAVLDKRLEVFLSEKLPAMNPMVRMFLNNDVIVKMKAIAMEELVRAMPELTESAMGVVEESLDFHQLVVDKIDAFDLDVMEQIILRIAAKELRAIEILGGVLGFAIGLLTDILIIL